LIMRRSVVKDVRHLVTEYSLLIRPDYPAADP
jgi:hypothetical protein